MLGISQNWRDTTPQIESHHQVQIRIKKNTLTHHYETVDPQGEEENHQKLLEPAPLELREGTLREAGA